MNYLTHHSNWGIWGRNRLGDSDPFIEDPKNKMSRVPKLAVQGGGGGGEVGVQPDM